MKIQKGLNVPILGEPAQDIEQGPAIKSVGIVSDDYLGMKPTMLVQVGDKVKAGQAVFEDKKTEGVVFASPVSGTVASVNRGEKRKFESLVVNVVGNDSVQFESYSDLQGLTGEQVRSLMAKSGMWVALRTRPYNRIPALSSEPHSLFVTAMDTNPLSAEPELIIEAHKEEFVAGLTVLTKLTRGKTFVCTRDHSRVPGANVPNTVFERFDGPHPAGLPGTHIHFLDPVGPKKTVWFLNYQDVIAIGHLFRTGRVWGERVVALGGPRMKRPMLVRTLPGACIDDLLAGRLEGKNNRVISGSVLSGRKSEAPKNYLGRFHLQVSALEEGTTREFLGWQMPGADKFSITKAFLGSWLAKKFPLTTSTGGSHRAMVPIGSYERVMPLGILPTQLLRALLVRDTDSAQQLGCLELDEEDLALCTFVCPGKYDYGKSLRESLQLIEKEG